MVRKFLVFLVVWMALFCFLDADAISIYSISNEKVVFEDDEKAIINFEITNNTGYYYPEVFCVPTLKLQDEMDYTKYFPYYEYEAKCISLEPSEVKSITFECTIPKKVTYKAKMLEVSVHSVSLEEPLTKEFKLSNGFIDLDGFLEDIKPIQWKLPDGKDKAIEEKPIIEPNDLLEIHFNLRSTFETEKKIYPQFLIYKNNNVYPEDSVYKGKGEAIIFNPYEEKEVLLKDPKLATSGNYLIKLKFIDESGKIVSRLHNLEYAILGESAYISGVRFEPSTKIANFYIYGTKGKNTLNSAKVEVKIYDANKALLDTVTKNVSLNNGLSTIDIPLDSYNTSKLNLEVRVSSNNKTLCTKKMDLTTDFSIVKSGLTDIIGRDCEEAVRILNGAGIINGYLDNTFKPDNLVTRAEFAAIIIKLREMKLEDSDELLFPDTYNHWGRPHINALYKSGFVSGYPDGTFGPQNNVTYAEAITILLNALGYKGEVNKNDISWPYNYINKAKDIKIIDDLNIENYFDNANREDIALLAMKAYLIK